MTTIDTLLGYWGGYCPDKTAMVFGDRRVSFDEHHRRVLRCASALRSLGLRHGESLAVMLRNCIELPRWSACAGKTLKRELREHHLAGVRAGAR